MNETYIKAKGEWKYLYKVVDKEIDMVDFLLTKKRKRLSAQSFLIKAIENNGFPELINLDRNGTNMSAVKVYNKRSSSKINIRQCKYLNNIVEQEHKRIKGRLIHGLGCKESQL